MSVRSLRNPTRMYDTQLPELPGTYHQNWRVTSFAPSITRGKQVVALLLARAPKDLDIAVHTHRITSTAWTRRVC
jgi:hypothetical protein